MPTAQDVIHELRLFEEISGDVFELFKARDLDVARGVTVLCGCLGVAISEGAVTRKDIIQVIDWMTKRFNETPG